MTKENQQTVFLSLGSNLGDRRAHLMQAAEAVSEIGETITISSVYETEPIGYTEQNHFYNAVLCLRTSCNPEAIMEWIFLTEKKSGRERSFRYAPRTLDIDIIFFGNKILHLPGIHIPHPEYARRRFVLEPLCEIAPDWICPRHQQSVSELLRLCNDPASVVRLHLPLWPVLVPL